MRAQRATLCWNTLVSLIKHQMQTMSWLRCKQCLPTPGCVVHCTQLCGGGLWCIDCVPHRVWVLESHPFQFYVSAF